jgi:hypothetical protein
LRLELRHQLASYTLDVYAPGLQTVLFVKVVLALTSGRPAEAYLDTQRASHMARMRDLTEVRRRGTIIDALLADHARPPSCRVP